MSQQTNIKTEINECKWYYSAWLTILMTNEASSLTAAFEPSSAETEEYLKLCC